MFCDIIKDINLEGYYKLSQHQKILTKKQKIIIYASAAAVAIIAAIIAVIILVHTVENPPDVIFNSNNSSQQSSNTSFDMTSSEIFIPEASVVITPEDNKDNLDEIIEIVDKIEQTPQNTIVVKNDTVDTSVLSHKRLKLDVKYLPQNPELPTGCEITSLTTVLNFYGYDVTKTVMADKYLEKSQDRMGDFWEVFVGDPRKNGFGCYAKPIVKAANKYLAAQDGRYKAINYSGATFEDLLKIVENGTPVIIWGTMYGEKENDLRKPFATVKWNVNGKELQWIAPEHCMVLIGYDINNHSAILSDPQRGIVEYDLDTVKSRYLAMHSQCVVVEKSSPVITGIKNGEIYYTTQYVTIEANNIESITVNGEESEKSFFIDGNADNMYIIEVTDIFGDVTTYTVYTKKIKSLIQPIEGLGKFTVTADDTASINAVKKTIYKLSTKYSPIEESRAIEDILTICEDLLGRISEVNNEIKRIVELSKQYEAIDGNKGDHLALHTLSDDINILLSTENLTETQRTELVNILKKINEWLSDPEKSEESIIETE